eukprot:scpid93478/ scgid10335/ 
MLPGSMHTSVRTTASFTDNNITYRRMCALHQQCASSCPLQGCDRSATALLWRLTVAKLLQNPSTVSRRTPKGSLLTRSDTSASTDSLSTTESSLISQFSSASLSPLQA